MAKIDQVAACAALIAVCKYYMGVSMNYVKLTHAFNTTNLGDALTYDEADILISVVQRYDPTKAADDDLKQKIDNLGFVMTTTASVEAVNHPAHYGGADDPYEAIKVIEAWDLGFNLGNCVKYVARAGKKGDRREDLKKAAWYLNREVERG